MLIIIVNLLIILFILEGSLGILFRGISGLLNKKGFRSGYVEPVEVLVK